MFNIRLCELLDEWISDGSKPQECFDTRSMRAKWIERFPLDKEFLMQLPMKVDRTLLRQNCLKLSNLSPIEKFLTVMIWGYGDRGYGPYRVKKIVGNSNFDSVIAEVVDLSNNSNPIAAYNLLSQERLLGLGPSYGTKFISFCTPREISAPILDSYILDWISNWAEVELLGGRRVPKTWDEEFYKKYSIWIANHADKYSCYPDDVELAIFRDAERYLSKNSAWKFK